jgi:hypothetical protein
MKSLSPCGRGKNFLMSRQANLEIQVRGTDEKLGVLPLTHFAKLTKVR